MSLTRFKNAVSKRRRREHLITSAEREREKGREEESHCVSEAEESRPVALEETRTHYVPVMSLPGSGR